MESGYICACILAIDAGGSNALRVRHSSKWKRDSLYSLDLKYGSHMNA